MSLLLPRKAAEKRLESDHYVEGYATTFDDPYVLYEYDGIKYREQIDRHALEGADLSDVIMQYDHDGRVLARNSNGTLLLEPDQRGFFIAAELTALLSAPAESMVRKSSMLRMPPPTVSGMNTCSLARLKISTAVFLPSLDAVMSRKMISSAPILSYAFAT